ncbi:uncharacterized protein LOC129790971 [Lutzomyia longipalpis]|uniref:uncharacterized protein LOC129790971 n=1 Tax=Lutzomyia longipalpis TaxID=7200 RepID=UPI002483DD66|nr:uncharacterized protein LOC129790971 [Lutzomyia longipalpis]
MSSSCSQNTEQELMEDDGNAEGKENVAELEGKVAKLKAATEVKMEKYCEIIKLNAELYVSHEESTILQDKIKKKMNLVSNCIGRQMKDINFIQEHLAEEKAEFKAKMGKMKSTAGGVVFGRKALKLAEKTPVNLEDHEALKDLLTAKLKKLTDRNSALKTELEKKQIVTEEKRKMVSREIEAKKMNIGNKKKEMKALKAELANVNLQIKKKEEENLAKWAAETAKKESLERKINRLQEERLTLMNRVFKEVEDVKKLREKDAQLDRKIAKKQSANDEMKKQLEEENKQVRKAIEGRKIEIKQIEENCEKYRQRRDELKNILKDDAVAKVEQQIEKTTAKITKIRESNINLEMSLLGRDLVAPTMYSDSSRNSIIAWMRNIETSCHDESNIEAINENPTIDCEVSSTYQCDDNFDFK